MLAVASATMNGRNTINHRHNSAPTCTLLDNNNNNYKNRRHYQSNGVGDIMKKGTAAAGFMENASFMKWRTRDLLGVLRFHPIPCVLAVCLLFFMGVEYTLRMIPPSSPPFDLGFVVTLPIHRLLASWPALNTFLAALNTVFVLMQTGYILWTWVIEGRPRATISTLFMFTFRGILGYSTQLPLPEINFLHVTTIALLISIVYSDFLGSGADFPVGNVSFFLFYSGHVAASIIASLDMKRMHRWELAWAFDTLNFLQFVRLLSTRGHYTIDLVVGVGAGILFDYIAGKYEESKKSKADSVGAAAYGSFFVPSKQ